MDCCCWLSVCYVCVYSYMAQILNETLRWAIVGPYAARAQDTDIVIGGHHIPAGVCVCLCVLLLCRQVVNFGCHYMTKGVDYY